MASSPERKCLLRQEGMYGKVASLYDALGRKNRGGTYRSIAKDFIERASVGRSSEKNILDVGCGSGLLTIELAAQTRCGIHGIDISEDMLQLARKNLRRAGIGQKISLARISVYDLPRTGSPKEPADYVICRNALHRFRDPEKAIKQMFNALKKGGIMYLRDLKRDSSFPTIVERIGEQRWRTPELVKDYLEAMASMLTTEELEEILKGTGAGYEISDGRYLPEKRAKEPEGQLREFEAETEYVCLIRK